MTKDQLVNEWGKATRTDAPVQNEHGQTEVVWHYAIKPDRAKSGSSVAKRVFTSGTGFFDDPTEVQHYEFHFIDGRLASWKGSGAEEPRGVENS